MEPAFRRRRSDTTITAVLALVVASTALVVPLLRGGSEGQEPGTPRLWRALPEAADLPDGCTLRRGYVGGYGLEGATIVLEGPGRTHAYLTLIPSERGETGTRMFLTDLRDSVSLFPGRSLLDFPIIAEETVALRETLQVGGSSESFEVAGFGEMIVVWRRGAIVAQLTVYSVPGVSFRGQPRNDNAIDLKLIEDLARHLDARFAKLVP